MVRGLLYTFPIKLCPCHIAYHQVQKLRSHSFLTQYCPHKMKPDTDNSMIQYVGLLGLDTFLPPLRLHYTFGHSIPQTERLFCAYSLMKCECLRNTQTTWEASNEFQCLMDLIALPSEQAGSVSRIE